MSDPLLEYRGQDLHADGLRFQLVEGYAEPLSVRGEDTIVSARRGRIPRSRVGDVRDLRLDGNIRARTAAEWRVATDILAAIVDTELDPDELVMRGPYLGLPVGTTATITARTVNAVPGPIRAGKRFQVWSVRLESLDPDWLVEEPEP